MWVLELVGALTGYPAVVLDWLQMAVGIYVAYLFVQMVLEIARSRNANLGEDRLMNTWKILAVGMIASYVLAAALPLVAIVSMLIAFVANVVFLVTWYHTKKAYDNLEMNVR